MRKMILILLLAVVGNNAMAEWVVVNRSKYATGYADPATIVKDGNIAKMWSLVDCKTITSFIGGSPFMSIKSQEEFDCKEKKLRTLVYTLHSGRMGEGEVVFSNSNPSKWASALPENGMGDFLKIACGQN
jgi:Surface-adhesin protein E